MEIEGQSFIVQDTWARISTLSRTYYDIAADAYELYLDDVENRIRDPGDEHDPSEHMAQTERMTIQGIKVIVFSAMALEAAVFDFAAIHLGDEMAKEHLDKLDLLGKWVIVPQLVCGRALREDGPAFNNLRSLVKARNRLVHHKSMPYSKSVLAEVEKRSQQFRQDVGLALKTVVLLSLELEMLIGATVGVLPTFDKEVNAFNSQPVTRSRVTKAIADCRSIHRKNFDTEKA